MRVPEAQPIALKPLHTTDLYSAITGRSLC